MNRILSQAFYFALTPSRTLIILCCILATAVNPLAQPNSNRLEEYITNTIDRYDLPGLAYVVIKGNSVVAEGAYGYANLSTKSKTSTRTIYSIASMDKQLIATCIMILYEKGLIDLEQPITNYLKNASTEWSKIKVKNLLSHTSGY